MNFKRKTITLLKNKAIRHLQKCFSYALAANKENPLELKSNLEAITPHVLGDHSLCRESWCGFLKDQSKYRPKNLPYGKYLHGEDFRNELNAIFMDYANQSDRLCNLGSSQSNESFNNSVASKAKKSKYYGVSESLCYRVAAAGCQKKHRAVLYG